MMMDGAGWGTGPGMGLGMGFGMGLLGLLVVVFLVAGIVYFARGSH